ncbi:Fur family transcriptional regulator [Granulosicoccaceae sp. 1_MG-2023]|nr:Fur family transcriptional regulator [Granulosicoccaceae sp. 1_MG-2023]
MDPCHEHEHCIDEALRQGEEICRSSGQRFTDIRRKVLQLVWRSHKPAKAYDILEQLAEDETGAAKPPTVYRALEFLQDNGLVHRLSSLNAFIGCTHPGKQHQCYFLICRICGDVSECCSSALTRSLQNAAAQSGFTVESSCVEISGRCSRCSENPA